MLKSVREAAGLGSPPAIFTTNTSESLNKVIEQHVHYKSSQWLDFNDSMRSLVAAKREGVIHALSDRGLFRLRLQYAHLGIDPMTWQRKRPDQYKKLIRCFDECSLLSESITCPPLKPHSDAHSADGQGSSSRSLSDLPESSCHISISIQSPSKEPSKPHSNPHTESSSLPSPAKGMHHITISPSESGITTLHQGVLQAIWEKAERLLNQKRGLQRAASSDPTARSVQSSTSAVPHFITSKADGQFLCDTQCPQWVSSKICSHTVAVAERCGKLATFLNWYVTTNQETNITSLGLLNMPKGCGQKGGVPKRKRCRAKAVEPETVVLRPSLQSPCSSVSLSVSSSPTVNAPTFHSPTVVPFPHQYNPYMYDYPHQSPPGFSTQPTNPNPFYLKFITGNIRMCQGCKGITEVCWFNHSRTPTRHMCCTCWEASIPRFLWKHFVSPTTYKPSYNHLALTYIQAVEPAFVSYSLKVPTDVQNLLSTDHKDFIWMQMGIWI